AVRIMRGSLTLVVSRSTTKPSGTRGSAPGGRRTSLASLSTDGVAYGAGRSSGVSLRRTPGASVVQSPIAAPPVSTAAAAGAPARHGAPAASVDTSTAPAIAGARRDSADRMPALYRGDRGQRVAHRHPISSYIASRAVSRDLPRIRIGDAVKAAARGDPGA